MWTRCARRNALVVAQDVDPSRVLLRSIETGSFPQQPTTAVMKMISLNYSSRWIFKLWCGVILLFFTLIWAINTSSFLGSGVQIDLDVFSRANNGFEQGPNRLEPAMNTDILSENKRNTSILESLLKAVNVMQSRYFEVWEGIWPTAIDWTSAVIATHVAATTSTLSSSINYTLQSSSEITPDNSSSFEGLINRYFSHVIGFYFGQDAVTIRSEAYDDMLWVVLEWLEAIKFVNLHSLHRREVQALASMEANPSWYGEEWVPGFAHRARIFWDLASVGWNTSLCGGGMIWSPYLLPYKNAITNELFITASISMYLYFPGDDNTSPFTAGDTRQSPRVPIGPQDPKYLEAAIEGYQWLASSNMMNEKGLYIDGFHISEYNPHNLTKQKYFKCDIRNEMVYTYNQGVILSGQRGLWEATGSKAYLKDGHALISSVINATGFDLDGQRIYPDAASSNSSQQHLGTWHGIGRLGILEEACDAYGTCSQDGQTFKGIFFHHLTTFCQPLPPYVIKPGETVDVEALEEVKEWHVKSCERYEKWIERNAAAAEGTVNADGESGMWWGAHLSAAAGMGEPQSQEIPKGAVDYRNKGVPSEWVLSDSSMKGRTQYKVNPGNTHKLKVAGVTKRDTNDRGRGRTVETQSGLVAVLRAAWELSNADS